MTTDFILITATATCHTVNCENCDVPIEVQIVVGGTVICGPCGLVITDVVPVVKDTTVKK
jgi:hypothetical protein